MAVRKALGFACGRARSWFSILRLVPLAGWRVVVTVVVMNLAMGVLPVVFIVAASVMLERIAMVAEVPHAPGGWSAVLPPLVVAISSLVLQSALSPAQVVLDELVIRRVDRQCIRRFMTFGLTGAPMALLDERDVIDKIMRTRELLAQRWLTAGGAVDGLLGLIVRYTQVTGAVVLGGIALGPLAGVLLGATAAILRFTTRSSQTRWMIIATHSLNRPYLKMRYVLGLGSDQSAGKEVRVLGILSWLHARISADAAEYLNPLWQERRRVYFIPFLVVSALVLAGTLTLLTLLRSEAAAGTVSVLGLALAIQAILVPVRMGTFFPDIDPKTMWGLAAHDAICELEALIPARPRASTQVQPCGLPTGQTLSSIRFEEVRFTYPGSDRAVLSGLNLELTPGESTAIVGLNGAGKTTIIKLLVGLYQPTGGRITVDGLDLRDIHPRDWQSRLAVIFQDYVRYQLDAAANIGLGAAARMGDDAALRAAAEDAGAAEIIDALPAGLATPLSSAFTGGVQLSGGQWQRIALARALFAVKAGADLLVLDEPTAQLDARAEVTFFNRFLDLTRGLTSVVISHRFSTVRRADRIVVLEGGRIHEQGSHAELLGAGGRYAELFHLQARRFTATQGNRAREAQ